MHHLISYLTPTDGVASVGSVPGQRLGRSWVRPSRLSPSATDDVEIDGEDDDDAGRDDLPLLRHIYKLQSVGERFDDERADDGAKDRAHAAGERRAADDDRGNGVEFVAVTEGRLGRVDAGGQQDAAEARK